MALLAAALLHWVLTSMASVSGLTIALRLASGRRNAAQGVIRPDAGVPSGVVPKERGHPPTLPPLA